MSKLLKIVKEIKVEKSASNLDTLNKMLTYKDDGENSLLEIFMHYNTFEEWYESNKDEDEDQHELIMMAKIFFKWVKNKDLIHEKIDDTDENSTTLFSKNYKRMITYGLGYNNARVILTTF